MKTTNYLKSLLCILFLSAVSTAQSNVPETQKAVELYKKGDYYGAISTLQPIVKANKNDGEAFYFLGMSQLQKGDLKESQKSLKKSAKLLPADGRPAKGLSLLALLRGNTGEAKKQAQRSISLNPNDAEAHYFLGVAHFRTGNESAAMKSADTSISLNPQLVSPYILKAEAVIYDDGAGWYSSASPAERTKRFTDATSILEKYPDMTSDAVSVVDLRNRLEALKAFADYFSKQENQKENVATTPPTPDPNYVPLEIVSMPRPRYTDNARMNNVTGVVRVLVLFSKDGRTLYPIVLNGLKNGLTEQALSAAQQIKFSPAKKNGEPLSTVRVLEYGFNIY